MDGDFRFDLWKVQSSAFLILEKAHLEKFLRFQKNFVFYFLSMETLMKHLGHLHHMFTHATCLAPTKSEGTI